MKQFFSLIALFVAFSSSLWANNLVISSSKLVDQNSLNKTVNIQFDISWDNSWRTSAEPNNWDAVWLFVKYKKASDSNWYHATLNTNDANHFTGLQEAGSIIDARSDGKGAFFYRSADGTGTFTSNQVKLCWNYGTDSIGNKLSSELTEIKVFGIEMCYIPQGAFYVGSGGEENDNFYTYGGNNPYKISSEGAISIGTANGDLYYNNNYGGAKAATIPDSFPKGYNAIYCMKYEITQKQYCDFLNTLRKEQQTERCPFSLNEYRFFIKLVNGVYGCDANNNSLLNESEDGQSIACNYLSWADGIAYSDWSGLRPMTELEYEKICRGSAYPVANELAWGSTSVIFAGGNSNIINPAQASEGSNINGANCNYSYDELIGPLRVGCFSSGSRQSSGSSYYGVMEMSGNLFERCVTIANKTGRIFTGLLGDGELDKNGDGNIANCPEIKAEGAGFRGGSWSYEIGYEYFCTISDRGLAELTDEYRSHINGFRCVSGL